MFPNGRTHYLQFEGSGHRPIFSIFDPTKKKPHKLFRYDRRLMDNEEVKDLIARTWNEFHYLDVPARIARCRTPIVTWSREFYINNQKEILRLKEEMDSAMTNTTAYEALISNLNLKLLLAYKSEEEYWKQRSRQLWLSLGDRKTGLFHASTKERRARNRLSVIEDPAGLPVVEYEQITEVISEYFRLIFSSSNPSRSEVVEEDITPCIDASTNERLNRNPIPK